MKTVAVFFGGRSNEHEISVITGMFAAGLLRGIYRVLPVLLPQEGGMLLAEGARGVKAFCGKNKFPAVEFIRGGLRFVKKHKKAFALDCALNCCHGGAGEDGTLSALLDWYEIPSASPDLSVSAMFMDKSLSKIAAKGLDIPVLPSFVLHEEERGVAAERMNVFGYPAVIKPCKLGSSIGVSLVRGEEELFSALDLAFRLDSGVLVEKYLENKRDLNCALCRMGGKTALSPVEEVFSAGGLLSFGEKYEHAVRTSQIPARIPEEAAEEIRSIMRLIGDRFSVRGIVRGDFLYDGDKIYFNELNTVPGSLALYLFGESMLSSREFLQELIEGAMKQPESQKEIFTTGILRSGIFAGAKTCKRRQNQV